MNMISECNMPSICTFLLFSVFYIFYDQYLDIGYNSAVNLAICAFSIFIVTLVLLGFDIWTALIVMGTVSMTTTSLFGLMRFWKIELNALSLVNVVICMGISVEFCSHIARAFALSSRPSRLERAREALVHMGSSVSLSYLFNWFKIRLNLIKLFHIY